MVAICAAFTGLVCLSPMAPPLSTPASTSHLCPPAPGCLATLPAVPPGGRADASGAEEPAPGCGQGGGETLEVSEGKMSN